MPKTSIIKNMEKSVAKKMVNEDDPGFKWWKDGNGLASFAHAKANPPPKGYTLIYEKNGPGGVQGPKGERIVRAYKDKSGAKYNRNFNPTLAGGNGRKDVNQGMKEVWHSKGLTTEGTPYNRRGKLRKMVPYSDSPNKEQTGYKWVGKNRGK